MKYWMKFYDNKNVELLSISTLHFMGEDLDISHLKQRFNKDFVQNKEVKAVKIAFLDVFSKINKLITKNKSTWSQLFINRTYRSSCNNISNS